MISVVLPEPKKTFPDRDPRPLFDGGPVCYALKLAGIDRQRCRIGRKGGRQVLHVRNVWRDEDNAYNECRRLLAAKARLQLSFDVVWV